MDILIIGAGKIGLTISHLLENIPEATITVADSNQEALAAVPGSANTLLLASGITAETLKPFAGVINAAPFFMSECIAQAAMECGISYFDLTEDVAATKRLLDQSDNCIPGQVLVPQCGLAPGFISILAADICNEFSRLDSVQLRVGALPRYPNNQMLYNLTWSTDGLVNEYCNPCQAIENSQPVELAALDGKEEFSLDGITYEAFNTSGGLGTLPLTLQGKVHQLNYKTVRYPGHRDLMKFLLRDLKFQREPQRQNLVNILDESIPVTRQDVVLIMVSVSGYRHTNGNNSPEQFEQITDVRRIYPVHINQRYFSAIQITTAASLCSVIELWIQGKLKNSGMVRQEDIPYEAFMQTRFGHYLSEVTE